MFAGIAEPEKARATIERLMRDDMFSGFGLRTLSEAAPRYNPMSYHDGSVWPHDNALCAAGFARYGATRAVVRVVGALFDASHDLEDCRLPELFCGFPRSQWHGPVPYPVACTPQAWAAGSVFLLVQSLLGMTVDGFAGRIVFERAAMPEWMSSLEICGLSIGEASLDLHLTRGRNGLAVEVIGKRGEIDVVVRC